MKKNLSKSDLKYKSKIWALVPVGPSYLWNSKSYNESVGIFLTEIWQWNSSLF